MIYTPENLSEAVVGLGMSLATPARCWIVIDDQSVEIADDRGVAEGWGREAIQRLEALRRGEAGDWCSPITTDTLVSVLAVLIDHYHPE